MPARIALAVLALAVGAWLVPGLRDAHREAFGERVALGGVGAPTRAEYAAARHDLVAAIGSAPDERARYLLAGLNLRTDRPADALPLLREIVRREPDNLEAWALMTGAAQQADEPATAARARREVLRLNPLAAR
jgi:Tetratricopeptide repeat